MKYIDHVIYEQVKDNRDNNNNNNGRIIDM